MKKALSISSLLILAIANTAQAHPGHDHSSWTSPLTHTLFYGSIAAVVGTAFYVMRQARLKRQRSEQKDRQL
ncbi:MULTISPECIES: hypothetical protein [Cobetia]|uniref:hypothetical protein n=1 Tax=Cobetia TaxID=204286 RepID=UPI000469E7A3|nr:MULTISPECIES: hypothetical protein [Cobetia]